jgi:hypothetical protein
MIGFWPSSDASSFLLPQDAAVNAIESVSAMMTKMLRYFFMVNTSFTC